MIKISSTPLPSRKAILVEKILLGKRYRLSFLHSNRCFYFACFRANFSEKLWKLWLKVIDKKILIKNTMNILKYPDWLILFKEWAWLWVWGGQNAKPIFYFILRLVSALEKHEKLGMFNKFLFCFFVLSNIAIRCKNIWIYGIMENLSNKNVLFGIFFLWLNYFFVITVYATKQGNMLLKVGGVQFTQSSGILS